LWLDQPALTSDSLQDKRAKIREDPLFIIKKEEQNQKTSLKNNPIKMQKLRKEILMRKLQEELKKEKKRKRHSEPPSTKKEKTERREGEGERYRKRHRDHPSTRDRSPSPPRTYRKKEFSLEERQQKLLEMQQGAIDLEKQRLSRINTYNKEYTEEANQALAKDNRKSTPEFINSMGKAVFSSGPTATLEDRVKRNRYYIQKDNLDERGIFK